ncbi:MAG TPA: hypothetical protein ENN36_09815 [Candidatus Bathyarchaeota archaeon]|nr:hypothetical protein [Candidatus Bathyarchaeota archaeon]
MNLSLGNLGFRKGFLIAFAVGFAVRLIPEILSYPYPIGWDTIYYAYRISDGALFGYWNNIFSTWLPYGIMIFLGNLTGLDPFLLLKILAPLLYGGAAAGVYFVAWKKLNWSVTKSLLASGFFSVQLAALAISWHFHRNIFGVMILLFALPFIKSDIGWKEAAVLGVLSVLVVWGHELAAVSLFFIVFAVVALSVFKNEEFPFRLFVAVVPALAVFLASNLGVLHPSVGFERSILWLGDSVYARAGGLFFLTDYLNVFTPYESYASYFDLFGNVFSLFVLLYLVLLPLIAVGYFKDRVLGAWTFLLMVGAFGCLVVPFAALMLWNRWMLMLVFPFTFFAVEGLWNVIKGGRAVGVSRFLKWFKITKTVGVGLVLASVIVGALFMVHPLADGKYGIVGWESTFRYVPSTMQSSSVPLQDTEGTVEAFKWLNSNMDGDSVLLAHDVFSFWTLLYLDEDHSAIVFDHDLEAAATLAVDEGFDSAYFVWWNEDIGWYNLRLQDDWVSVQDFGRISVYKIV